MIPSSPDRLSLSRSATDSVGASVYGPLARSGFGVRKASLPAAVQLPQSVRDAVAEPIPKEYTFELETATVEQWNRLQNRKFAEAEAEAKRQAAEAEAEAQRKEAAELRRQESQRKREAAEAEAAIERVANAERDALRREEAEAEAARQAEIARRREMEDLQKAASMAVLAAEEEGLRLEAESKRMRELALQDAKVCGQEVCCRLRQLLHTASHCFHACGGPGGLQTFLSDQLLHSTVRRCPPLLVAVRRCLRHDPCNATPRQPS